MRKVVSIAQRPDASGIIFQILTILAVTAGLALLFSIIGIGLAALFTGESIAAFSQSNYSAISTDIVNGQKIVHFVSVIGVFILPAIILPRLLFKINPYLYTGLRQGSGFLVFVLALLTYFAWVPMLELTIQLNMAMDLPAAFEGLESWMRRMEESQGELTRQFLYMPDQTTFVINIFIMAILPAVAEEFFFRGFLQRTFHIWWQNKHLAIWLSAFLFSAIHVQFFGFLPRFLLGALLGYLLVWSGSLYIPIFVHFLNNFTSILAYYIAFRSGKPIDINSFESYPNSVYVFSLILGSLGLYLFYKLSTKPVPSEDAAEYEAADGSRWIKIYSTQKEYEAEIVAGNLKSSGIDAVIVNKKDSSYGSFGHLEVHVPERQAERAAELLPSYGL